MKTPLIYGLGIAFAMAVLSLTSHILGLTTDPDKFMLNLAVGMCGTFAILITGLILGTKAVRAQHPPAAAFTYGQAFKAGFFVTLFAALGMAVYFFIYYQFIFTNFVEVTLDVTRNFMEKMNAPASKVDEVLEQLRAKTTVFSQVRGATIFTIVLGSIISLITSAVMKRAPAEDLSLPPPVA